MSIFGTRFTARAFVFAFFLLTGGCAPRTGAAPAVPDDPPQPVFKDPFFLYEFEQPGDMERQSTPDENSTVFTVNGRIKLSIIRRHTSMTFPDFVKDFEGRVLGPQFQQPGVEKFDLGPVHFAGTDTRIYGLKTPAQAPDEMALPGTVQLGFILITQTGNTFIILATEGYSAADEEIIRRDARILARSLRIRDNARLYTDLEAEGLKACKLVMRLRFSALSRDVSSLLKACINLHPYFDGYYTYLAEVERLIGREQESLAVLDKALSVFPRNATLLNNQAWYLLTFEDRKLRDYPRALEISQKAVELTNRRSAALLHTLAQAYLETGNILKAIETLEVCKQLGAQEPETAKAVRELEQRIQRMRI